MRRVIVESPFKGKTADERRRNLSYARRAMRDCLLRGESPIASHLLYTQPGVLDDQKPDERALGIRAGLIWAEIADATVCYIDLGISAGMKLGIEHAECMGRPVEKRKID